MDDTVLLPSSKKQHLSKEQTFGEGIDIISSLSDNVLLHIFSFLSAKDCIQTSILSRIWQYLWTSIANIDLIDVPSRYGKRNYTCRKKDQCPVHQSFLDFVERVLLLHDSSDIKRLCLHSLNPVNSSCLNSWISAAIRHNIQELDLFLPVKKLFLLPCCLFTCESLLVLKLFMDCVLKAPSCINFSSLKTLEISRLTFSDDEATQHLLSSCPVLQELALTNCGWKNIKTLTISIPTLKRLTIADVGDTLREDVPSCVVKIYAPNVIYLNFTSNLDVNFHLCDLSSLVDAYIDLRCEDMLEQDVSRHVIGVLTAICNVKFLHVMRLRAKYLIYVKNLMDHLPTFHNMAHLELNAEFCNNFYGCMIDLLEKTPKLQFLDFAECLDPFIIHDHLVDLILERVPSCFCCIKMFSLRYFLYQEEMDFLRFLLKNATVLERMTIVWNRVYEDVEKEEEEEINNQLRTFHRVSESCVIELL